MAHHLAELIETARTAGPSERAAAQERCSALILEVWRHRNCLPDGRRPFERLEPTLDTLAALDPANDRPFYLREVWEPLDRGEAEAETVEARRWLNLARRCDAVARVLLEALLVRAVDAAGAAESEREWVRKATGADALGSDIEVIRRIITLSDDLRGEPAAQELRAAREKPIRRRLDALTGFEEVAHAVRADLEERLAAASRDEPGDAGEV
jgi:hypothetical protein